MRWNHVVGKLRWWSLVHAVSSSVGQRSAMSSHQYLLLPSPPPSTLTILKNVMIPSSGHSLHTSFFKQGIFRKESCFWKTEFGESSILGIFQGVFQMYFRVASCRCLGVFIHICLSGTFNYGTVEHRVACFDERDMRHVRHLKQSINLRRAYKTNNNGNRKILRAFASSPSSVLNRSDR